MNVSSRRDKQLNCSTEAIPSSLMQRRVTALSTDTFNSIQKMTATRFACTRKCKYFVTIHQVSGEKLWYTLYKSQQYEIWYRTHGFVHNTVVPSEYILGVPLGWAYRPITTNMRTVQNLTSFPALQLEVMNTQQFTAQHNFTHALHANSLTATFPGYSGHLAVWWSSNECSEKT